MRGILGEQDWVGCFLVCGFECLGSGKRRGERWNGAEGFGFGRRLFDFWVLGFLFGVLRF